jgi:hypothetical protein
MYPMRDNIAKAPNATHSSGWGRRSYLAVATPAATDAKGNSSGS